MVRHKMVLEDGQCLPSGDCAIRSVRLTRKVNTGTELAFGAVCSAMAEITLFCEDSANLPGAGRAFTLQKEEDGSTEDLGVFYVEKPQRTGYGCWTLTAYDAVSLLDKDLGDWLQSLTVWPIALKDLIEQVCARCGAAVNTASLEQGAYLVQKLTLPSVTGRQILQWAGELSGQFCRANDKGVLEFGWYIPKALTVGPTGEYYYYERGLKLSDYETARVRKVILRQTGTDVGTVYPDSPEDVETYLVTGNGLLSAGLSTDLQELAKALYEKLKDISYTPCTLELPQGSGAEVGDVISVLDAHGKTHTVYIMEISSYRFRDTITCTGSPSRGSTSAVNYRAVQGVRGRVLELQTAVEGLKAENRDQAGNLARLALSVEGIESSVSAQKAQADAMVTQLTALEQSAQGLSLAVKTIQEDGASAIRTETGYTFDGKGLRIQKSGEEMENLLDNTGMYVRRGDDVILRANNQGVSARDVTVDNFLIIGSHARLEDYQRGGEKRTACFYLT